MPTVEELQGFLSWLASSGWIREADDERSLRWLSARLPGLLADRERIEWLTSEAKTCQAPSIDYWPHGDEYEVQTGESPRCLGETLRDAIDNARAAIDAARAPLTEPQT